MHSKKNNVPNYFRWCKRCLVCDRDHFLKPKNARCNPPRFFHLHFSEIPRHQKCTTSTFCTGRVALFKTWTSHVFYRHVCSQRVQIHIMWPWYITLRYLRSYCPLTQSVWGIAARGDTVLEELPRLCIWCPLLRKVGCHHTHWHTNVYMCVPHILLTNYNTFVDFTMMLLHYMLLH